MLDVAAAGDIEALGVVSVSLPLSVLADKREGVGSTLVFDCCSGLATV